jgi:putative ABC transport system substrate-binding protein
VQLQPVYASSEGEFESAFATMHQTRASALMIPPDILFLDRRRQLGALTLRHAIPAIHTYREFAESGGLMTYGSVMPETFRQVGIYTGRILKGEKPADLPVQRSTKVELIVNLKTASALGLMIPLTLRGRADEVIE